MAVGPRGQNCLQACRRGNARVWGTRRSKEDEARSKDEEEVEASIKRLSFAANR